MWHVSSRSSVATLRTAIHLLLTYLPSDYFSNQCHNYYPVHWSQYTTQYSMYYYARVAVRHLVEAFVVLHVENHVAYCALETHLVPRLHTTSNHSIILQITLLNTDHTKRALQLPLFALVPGVWHTCLLYKVPLPRNLRCAQVIWIWHIMTPMTAAYHVLKW